MKILSRIITVLFVLLTWNTIINNAQAEEIVSSETPTGNGEECVVRIVAPQTKGNCKLGSNHAHAKLVIEGWYESLELTQSNEFINANHSTSENPELWDMLAESYFTKFDNGGSNGIYFWNANPIDRSNPDYNFLFINLSPAAGEKDAWFEVPDAFSKAELDQAAQAATTWAKAWKNYRGDKFYKIIPQ
ncbi:MAG: hypothetical protein HON65_16140 [Rhodospirillales bacterium]|nr:hypothetical protein [Rhodospirillales bacterium]